MTGCTIKHVKNAVATNQPNIPSHWLEQWLLCVLDKPRTFLITDSDYSLSAHELSTFMSGIEKMQKGVPVAYLIGTQEFWSLAFFVNEHTLIPRADTEVLVETTLAYISDMSKSDKTSRLLDLGTGSGCIAISLAHELAHNADAYGDWQVTAVDVSQQALMVARKNAEYNQVSNIDFVHSSWFDTLDSKSDTFAVIVSNPPYIDKDDEHLGALSAEPLSALVAHNHGLADIDAIIANAPEYLHEQGLLVIEHGYNQGEAVRRLFTEGGFINVRTIQDYGGNDRITLATFD